MSERYRCPTCGGKVTGATSDPGNGGPPIPSGMMWRPCGHFIRTEQFDRLTDSWNDPIEATPMGSIRP